MIITTNDVSEPHAEMLSTLAGAMALNPQASVVCVLVRTSGPTDPVCETKLFSVLATSGDVIAAGEQLLESSLGLVKGECDCADCAKVMVIVADALALLEGLHGGEGARH